MESSQLMLFPFKLCRLLNDKKVYAVFFFTKSLLSKMTKNLEIKVNSNKVPKILNHPPQKWHFWRKLWLQRSPDNFSSAVTRCSRYLTRSPNIVLSAKEKSIVIEYIQWVPRYKTSKSRWGVRYFRLNFFKFWSCTN